MHSILLVLVGAGVGALARFIGPRKAPGALVASMFFGGPRSPSHAGSAYGLASARGRTIRPALYGVWNPRGVAWQSRGILETGRDGAQRDEWQAGIGGAFARTVRDVIDWR